MLRDELHRHRVEHFVADDHALEALGQRVEPAHARGGAGRLFVERLALARAQLAGQVDDRIFVELDAERGERVQQPRRELARARAEFHHPPRAARGERLRDGARERLREERRQLGRGHEIAAVVAAPAEFLRAAAVVTQARRVQHALHVAGKRDPSARRGDFGAQRRGERVGLRERVGAGNG